MKITSRKRNIHRWFLQLSAVMLFFCKSSNAQYVTTLAGLANSAGFIDGPSMTARFNNPSGVTTDKNGNIYIADGLNNCIRKINANGIVSTLAGNGSIGSTDGPGSAAAFYEPIAIACDTAGNLYIADTKNYKIRKVSPNGNVTTIAGQGTFGTTNGPVAVAQFGYPTGICVSPDGTMIYVADHNTHVIRKIFNGQVSTLAGIIYIAGSDDGSNIIATFNHPSGIDLDVNGNIVVADEWNNKVRLVSPAGVVSTIAGSGMNGSLDGPPSSCSFSSPGDVTIDNNGNIFVADGFNNTIRKIENSTLQVSTYVGTAGITGSADGIGNAASFNNVTGVDFNSGDNTIYIADQSNQLIRKLNLISSSQINLTTSALNNTVCFGDSIPLDAQTPGLSNYVFNEGGIQAGTSITGNINLAPLSSGQHIITCFAFDNNGAIAQSQQLIITVLTKFTPTVSPTGNVIFCNGDSALLNSQPGSAYLWSNGSTTNSIYITTAGLVNVTVVNTGGCKGTSLSVNVIVTQGPVANITPTGSSTICPGDSVLLAASTGSSWLWSNGVTTQTTYAQPGNYSVTIRNSSGCSTMSSPFTINTYPGSQATISPTGVITIIQGDSVILTSGNASTYLWSNATTTQNSVIYNSGYYSVSITTANGCQSTSSQVQVVVITKQQMISALGATTFCQGGNVIFQSIFSQGIQWYYSGQPIPGETNQQLTAIDSGFYQVAAFQNNQWFFSDSLLVTVNASPQIAIVSDTAVCAGTAPMIYALSDSGTAVDWYDMDTGGQLLGGGNTFQCPILNNTTTYYVEVTAPNGCKAIDRATLNIDVNLSPTADFQYTVAPQSGSFLVTFQNNSQAASGYSWVFGDTSSQNTSTLAQPTYIYNTAGNYNVLLLAVNTYGCTDTLLKSINVGGKGDWFIPTTFTPNGDGINDLFRVRGKNIITKNMKIFDQWGSLIYETDKINPTWDGFGKGQMSQNGNYIYKIIIEKQDLTEEELTGTITVIE